MENVMQASIKMSEDDVREAIAYYIDRKLGIVVLKSDIAIQVKSTQNYKSEWEVATFRADFNAKARDTEV